MKHGPQVERQTTDCSANVLEARKHGKTLFLRNYMFIHVSHMLLHVYPCIIHVVTLISSIHCHILNMLHSLAVVASSFHFHMHNMYFKMQDGLVHQPINNFLIVRNCSGGRPFVKISAFCSVVLICLATIPLLSPIWDRKK